MSEFTIPPPPVPGFGPAEPILEQFRLTPFAKMAQAGAQHAAGTVANDLQPALDVANDPRNAWIGMNPVGRAGAESLGLLVGVLSKLRGQSSRIAIHPQELNPKRFQTIQEGGLGKAYEQQGYPHEYRIQVALPEPIDMTPEHRAALTAWAQMNNLDVDLFANPWVDGIKGLNPGHALRRAADNWPNATSIRIVGKEGQ